MKNSYGIPCNDFHFTPKAKQDQITYRFVTNDGNTPSICTIRLGDTDPLTGEPITNVELFSEYYRIKHHQIYVQNRETKNRLSLDGLTFDDGTSRCERKQSFSVPALDPFAEEAEDIRALKAFAESLNGYMADIYEWLLVKYAGGKEKLSLTEIAERWDVSKSKAYEDKDEIIRMIREQIGSSRE